MQEGSDITFLASTIQLLRLTKKINEQILEELIDLNEYKIEIKA